MHVNLSSLLEILGVLLVVVAAFAFDVRAGAAVVGFVLVAVSYVMDDEPEVPL